MEKMYETLVNETIAKISELQKNASESVSVAEKIIKILVFSLNKLRGFVKKTGFDNQQDEIEFFKNIKPLLSSHLIFYYELLRLELRKPIGSWDVTKQYYIRIIKRIYIYFEKNREFIAYLRSGATYMDKHYFVRKKLDIKIIPDHYIFDHDEEFSTSHDYKIAELKAYEYLSTYLLTKIENINNVTTWEVDTLKWTKSKSALVELIYALYFCNCFNNGETNIKKIAAIFEKAFNIDLGDYYRIFIEIAKRKNVQTVFLETMLSTLKQKLMEKDS